MPEWSNGAVSKTVDRISDPRVRIPLSPQKKSQELYLESLRFLFLYFMYLFDEFSIHSFSIDNGCVDIYSSFKVFNIYAVAR